MSNRSPPPQAASPQRNHTSPRRNSSPPRAEAILTIHPKDFTFFLDEQSQLIRQISEKSGATVVIDRSHPPPSGKLNITGLPADVSHCKHLIDDRLHDLRAEKPIVMWIPVQKIGLIVGNRGSTIRSINSRTGAFATVNNHHVQGDKKQLFIYGPLSSATHARDMITDILDSHSHPEEDHQVKKLSIPHYMAGAIIGRGGANVRRINLQTGVYIRVEPSTDNKSENTVTLTGKPTALEEAHAMITGIIDQFQSEQQHYPKSSQFDNYYEPPQSESTSKQQPTFPASEKEEEKVRLSIREIDAVVGREGSSLEQIRTRSRAFIEFSLMDREQGHEEQTVYITGTRTEIIIALLLIEERLGRPVGELSKLQYINNRSVHPPPSSFRDRPVSPDGKTMKKQRQERIISQSSHELVPGTSGTSKSCAEFDNPKRSRFRKSDNSEIHNSHLGDSGVRRTGNRHDLATPSKERLETGEIDRDDARMFSESRAGTELRSRKKTEGESDVEENDADHRPRGSSDEGIVKKSWRSDKDRDSRKRRERGPVLVPVPTSNRSLPRHATPYLPMYPVPQTGHEPVGVFNPADPHGYPVYPGMHPLPSHYFIPQQAHMQNLSNSFDESSSDGDSTEIKSSGKADPQSATAASASAGEEAGSASSAGKDGKRRSSRDTPSRKRRKQHHPFVYGYPSAEGGYLVPPPLAMYPGHHHPALQDMDSKTVTRRSRRRTSENDNEKGKPSEVANNGTHTKSSDKEECSSHAIAP